MSSSVSFFLNDKASLVISTALVAMRPPLMTLKTVVQYVPYLWQVLDRSYEVELVPKDVE